MGKTDNVPVVRKRLWFGAWLLAVLAVVAWLSVATVFHYKESRLARQFELFLALLKEDPGKHLSIVFSSGGVEERGMAEYLDDNVRFSFSDHLRVCAPVVASTAISAGFGAIGLWALHAWGHARLKRRYPRTEKGESDTPEPPAATDGG